MRNPPTLAQHLKFFDAADMARYAAIISDAEAELSALGPALQAVTRPFFSALAEGEFTQIVVLLPYWLSDLLSLPEPQLRDLALAHLHGWWYYAAQDQLLDGQGQADQLLGGHLALVRMIEGYRRLGLAETPCWQDFLALTATSAEWHAQEWATRFATAADLSPDRLAPWTAELIIQRGAAFSFNTTAQLQLAGHDPHGPFGRDLIHALQSFSVARQLADDASDWHADLRAGQLNVVSASLMRRMYERGLAAGGEELDADRLMGYQVSDEPFWAEIEAAYHAASQGAIDALARHGGGRFSDLIRHQSQRHIAFWGELAAVRAGWRKVFGID